MKRLLTYIFAAFTAILMFSCKPSVPSDYIQPGDMEAILYDYHIAMSMAELNANAGQTTESMAVRQQAYKLAVLKEHGVTEAQFESSLKYYMRHTERMHDMYEALSERLQSESSAMGTGGDAGYRRILTANGDSADVWTGDRALLLMADEPYNKSSFAFKADTAFHKGDRLQLSFQTQYIVQEGSRDAVVLLTVKFANDSIASQYQRVSSNMRQSITIADTKRVGIKEVKGYMLFSRGINNPSSTLKLLFVSDIQLLRIHTKESVDSKAKTDSVKTENGPRVMNVAPELKTNRPSTPVKDIDTHEQSIDKPANIRQGRPVNAPRLSERRVIKRPELTDKPSGDRLPSRPLRRQ